MESKETIIKKLKLELEKIDKQLEKIGFNTPLTYGLGTQRLGHANNKREQLAVRKSFIRNELYYLGIEI